MPNKVGPMWSADGESIFYMSDRSGAENIYRQRIGARNTEAKSLTNFKDGRLLWPSASYDAREIVFERNFTIWKLETKSGAAAQVPITLRGAVSTPQVTHIQTNQFSDLALSPDGKKVALISHGDIFAASAADGGDAIRITKTPAPETAIQWAPDSKHVLYLSARNGHTQIFEYDLTANKEEQLTNAAADDEAPHFSPDGKRIAYVRGEHELHILTIDSKKDASLASGFLQSAALVWAPDGKFIAYTVVGAKSFRNINVVASDGVSPAQPVSFLANGETASIISWSHNGEYLLFDTGQRSEQSQIARVDLVPHLPKFREDQFRELFRNREPNPEHSPATTPEKRSDAPETPDAAHVDRTEPAKKSEPTRVVFAGIRDRVSPYRSALIPAIPSLVPTARRSSSSPPLATSATSTLIRSTNSRPRLPPRTSSHLPPAQKVIVTSRPTPSRSSISTAGMLRL